MSEPYRKTYRPWEPQPYRQEAQSPDAKLPEGDVVFFLLDTVPQLELSRFYASYEDETRGAPPFDPATMVCLLLYAYCVGVFSSRKIAQACERNLAFIALVGQERPDFRPISDFRKLHLDAFTEVFVHVLRVASETGLVKLGNIATDGTKIQGNASRHKAMSYGSMRKEVDRLREDIEALGTPAHQQDVEDAAALGSRRGDELPAELARREARLTLIEAAMRRLEARAQADAEAECPRRPAAGAAQKILATYDSGYYREAAAVAVEQMGFDPYRATGRQRHHAPEAAVTEPPATAQECMAAKVRPPAGRALYARRKVIVEPVFRQIKEARGFRRFLLRGLDNIRGEGRLVCLTP